MLFFWVCTVWDYRDFLPWKFRINGWNQLVITPNIFNVFQRVTRWWLQTFFNVHPEPWGFMIQFDGSHIFSNGLVKNHQLGFHFSSHHRSGKLGSWKIHSLQKPPVHWSSNSRIKSGEEKASAKKKNKRNGWPPKKLKGTSKIPAFPGWFVFGGCSAQAAQEEKKKLAEKRKARQLRRWF